MTTATGPTRSHRTNPSLIIIATFWPVMALLAMRGFASPIGIQRWADAVACIDPNVAPWWELTVLPRIGVTTAHRIVTYREDHRIAPAGSANDPVFARKADLTRVRGIGPMTLRRIAPYVCEGP